MGAEHDHSPPAELLVDKRYRKILAWVMLINFSMFIIEVIASYLSNSVSLLADSVDFFSDAFNCLISLVILSKSIKLRASASIFKAITMLIFALVVIYTAYHNYMTHVIPLAKDMGLIGFLALAANLSAAVLLFKFREGDSNRMSVWLCTRNDALGNVAIIIAGILVYFLRSNIPDLIVAIVMGVLALIAALQIFRKASHEIGYH